MKTKIQLINAAFSELRISGITSGPSNDDIELALEALEDMMRPLCDKYPTLGYNFEEVPDPNSSSGIPAWANNAIQLKLGDTIGARYGKGVDLKRLGGAMSHLSAKLAQTPAYQNSSRMPAGRGNSQWQTFSDFMPPYQVADPSSEVIGLNDSRFVSVDLGDEFATGEVLASAVVTCDPQLAISGTATSGNTVTFTVEAQGTAGVNFRIMIAITGTISTVANRVIYITVADALTVN